MTFGNYFKKNIPKPAMIFVLVLITFSQNSSISEAFSSAKNGLISNINNPEKTSFLLPQQLQESNANTIQSDIGNSDAKPEDQDITSSSSTNLPLIIGLTFTGVTVAVICGAILYKIKSRKRSRPRQSVISDDKGFTSEELQNLEKHLGYHEMTNQGIFQNK
eukprot:NODE_11_length_54881_cov_1.430718.p34 type:complete len:162 gc:universal NODE_11_length_54881_cov_1.430718:7088-7573(+)